MEVVQLKDADPLPWMDEDKPKDNEQMKLDLDQKEEKKDD